MRLTSVILLATAAALAGCAAPADREVLYQVSTINALMEGLYDGEATLADLVRQGDIGIGTFDALDGEMVVLDGAVYQVRADGKVYRPGPRTTTPFASVTFFDPDLTIRLDAALDLVQLEALMDRAAQDFAALSQADAAAGQAVVGAVINRNMPLAVRITGTFRHVKTRSVPRQVKPYPRLVDVAARQPTFEFKDVRGTVVGFRLPEFIKGINVPGWHLHFLTEDRAAGGHILELETGDVRVDIDPTPSLRIALPRGGEFARTDVSKDRDAEVRRVEKP